MIQPEFQNTDSSVSGNSRQYRYKKRNLIARGSFGVVYNATITESESYIGDQVVAVKCVQLLKQADFFADSAVRNARRSGWARLFNLKHSHLLAYHKASVVRGPGGIFVEFVMDYYKDGDLDALLSSCRLKGDKSPFDQKAVICFALQLADGLTFLHENGIIQGDIKPGNILVKSTDRKHRKLVIGDLDDYVEIQTATTSALDMSLFHGTVRYMSPEMLRTCLNEETNQQIGCKTDVWSLGCVILDLANHCVAITKKCLCRETTVQTTENLADYQFTRLINEGWVPFVAETIPVSVAVCIQECLRTDQIYRIPAEKLLEKLRDTAKELSRSADASEPVDQECFCSFS